MRKCDISGAGVMLMIWAVAFLIHGGFERQLGEAGGFLLLVLAIVGVWFGMAVRKECMARAGDLASEPEQPMAPKAGAIAKPEGVDDSFLQSLFGEDQLGMVIRPHIHIEVRLNEVLDLLVPYPGELPSLRYEKRARLACALGLTRETFAPLKELGHIRNRFGHKLDTTLTAKMVDALYSAFSESDRAVLLAGYAMTNKQLPELKLPADFSVLGPRDKFIMLAVTLDKILLVARKELEARRSK